MDIFDVPAFQKTYTLYKHLHQIRNTVPKQDRHTIWQRAEQYTLGIIEDVLSASALSGQKKLPMLRRASDRLNVLRILLRLAHDVQSIDTKTYTTLQERIDEIGRMFGGWIKDTNNK